MAKGWKRNSLDKRGVYTATLAAIKAFEKKNYTDICDVFHPTDREVLGNPTKAKRNELWNEIAIYIMLVENYYTNGLAGKYGRILEQRVREFKNMGQKVYA